MSKPCLTPECGRETNSKTGICAICTIDSINVEPDMDRPLERFDSLDRELKKLFQGDEEIIQPPRTASTPPYQGGEPEIKTHVGAGPRACPVLKKSNGGSTMRGKKECPKCGAACGVRKNICECGHIFIDLHGRALTSGAEISGGGVNLLLERANRRS